MPGEQEPLVAPELEENPATQADEPVNLQAEQAEAEAATGETEGEGEAQTEPEDDSEEFDWNGKKIRGPKGLKDSVLMHADYTQKTQAVAAERQQLQQARQAVEQSWQRSQDELRTQARLVNVEDELQKYAQLSEADWQKWEGEDFMAAQAGFRRFQQLQGTHGALSQQLNQLQAARSAEVEQATATRLRETRDFAEKNIKGWTPELDAKLTDFATNDLGLDRGTLIQAYNPAIYRALHLAWLGHQTLNKPAVKPAAANVETLKTVSAKSNPPVRKSFADMDMDEYVKARANGRSG